MTLVDPINRLDAHDDAFGALVATAREHADAGRHELAATYAQMAGQFAWLNHTGRFASPELEAVLAQLGATFARAPHPSPRADDPREVVHVVTQAYGTGGSTRAVECWLEQDVERRHRVCLTRQGPTPPPRSLLSRLRDGSDLVRLDTVVGGLMDRAAALRRVAASAEAIVLHTHPYDVVPVIAFARREDRPPITYVNHADHVFWVGTSVIDVVSNMRVSGEELTCARRGVAPERSIVMARPLMPRGRSHSRDDAKRELGVDPSQVLLVSAADGTKYRPVGPDSFLDLVIPVLQRHEHALLLVAGPSQDEAWQRASEATGGRIRALGRLPDVTRLQEAADVYLDSFPFSSLTSLLEAGSFGTPGLTYRGHPDSCGVLGADTPGVDEHLLSPNDPQGYREALTRAISDPAWRQELGLATQHAIADTHTGDGWRTAMGAVYAHAATLADAPVAGPAPRETGQLDVLVDGVMVQTGYAQGVPGALRDHLGLLPWRRRAAAWRRLTREGKPPRPRNAVPEWALPRLAHARRRLLALRSRPAEIVPSSAR